MSTNRIVIIGGSGFLGSNIIQALQSSGFSDVAYGNRNYNTSLDCDFIKLDLLDKGTMEKLKGFDTIINCSGQISKPFNFCYQLNSVGVKNIAEVLSESKARLIQISTVAVYGTAERSNEASPLKPETNYATAKALAERTLLEYYYDRKRLAILRLSNLYGVSQERGIIAYMLRSCNSDFKLNFNNDGTLSRSFMHVEDCAKLIVEVVRNPELRGIYNIKGHETFSIKELIQLFENLFAVKFETKFNVKLPLENIRALDDSKFRSAISASPKWKLFDFIEEELKKINT